MCGKTVPSYGPPNPAQAAAGQPTSLSTSYEPKAPQLSVAINTSPVPEPIQQDLPVDAASTITTIVRQIYDRLKGGLAMVWDGPDGHDPEWAPKTPEDSKHYPSGICRTSATTVEEEAWARACSELLVGAFQRWVRVRACGEDRVGAGRSPWAEQERASAPTLGEQLDRFHARQRARARPGCARRFRSDGP